MIVDEILKAKMRDLRDKTDSFTSGYGVGFLGIGTKEGNPFSPNTFAYNQWSQGYDAGCSDAAAKYEECNGRMQVDRFSFVQCQLPKGHKSKKHIAHQVHTWTGDGFIELGRD